MEKGKQERHKGENSKIAVMRTMDQKVEKVMSAAAAQRSIEQKRECDIV